MPETDDPRKALQSDDVAIRTAAARELGSVGAFGDVELLLQMAKGDKSPSVRLYAAGSAAEILLRISPTAEQRKIVLAAMSNYDPANNPSLPLVLAGVIDEDGIERLGRLMRDPRSDVRAGAFMALRRMSQQAAAVALLSDAIRRWLLAGKHPDDATSELVRLASEAGFPGMDEALSAAARRGRASAIAVQEALDWLLSRRDPASWVGLWLMFDERGETLDWLWFERGRVYGREGELGELTVGDGVGTVQGRPEIQRMKLGKPDEAGLSEAMRVGERTLWRHSGRALVKVIDAIDEPVLKICAPAAIGVAREIATLEGATAVRARVMSLWRGGALKEAEAVLASAVAGEKRIKPEIQWLIANVKLGLGELDTAKEALVSCLQSAPKKAAFRPEAEALLASLGG